jgi:hypothetical protein
MTKLSPHRAPFEFSLIWRVSGEIEFVDEKPPEVFGKQYALADGILSSGG